ncbi:MAG: hypothetical protein ACRDM1_14150 [Gaiellaceae bacterium]
MIEDRNYRLSHCLGFAAFDPGGRIGVVEELEYGAREDRPDYLVVRRGLLRRHRVRLSVEQIVEIDGERRRVVVHGAPVGRIRWQNAPEEILKAAEAPFAHIRGRRGAVDR